MVNNERLKKAIDLFLISFISLYFEILFIRWVPSTIQIVSYFTNIILISSFLGLGFGCLLCEKKFNFINLFPISILSIVALLMRFNNLQVKADFIQAEHLLGVYPARGINFLLIISIIFVFNTLAFITLGAKLGICLKDFRPLVSYSLNIAGSICGLMIFSLFSALRLPPFYWFLFGLLLYLWFAFPNKKQLAIQGAIIFFTLAIISQINPASRWSPYYRIDVLPIVSNTNEIFGFSVVANNTFHQQALDLSDSAVSQFPELKRYREVYEFPYRFVHPDRVLVLGAGCGNDYLTALRMGITDVSAVEIDPLIASLGQEWHRRGPDKHKRVNLYIDDARSFVKKTNEKFDLITFGYLDAHRVLSQFSSVRMDNFIYTKESFEDVRNRLSPQGVVAVTYFVFKEWVAAKLYATLREAFGENLLVFRGSMYNKDDTAIFLAGESIKNTKITDAPNFRLYDGFDKNVQFITDDWPYLYLFKRVIPGHYLIILVFVFFVSLLGLFFIRPGAMPKFNTHFFFLGAGFMLLEAVGITRFALLFGSTWLVNSFVIISILIMILLANLYVERARGVNINLIYVLLIVAILLNWVIKPEYYLFFSRGAGVVLVSLILSLPLLFAGIIFAVSFKKTKAVAGMFAYNLLGAILGGFCEYISMLTGFRFLLIVAALMYVLSYPNAHPRGVHCGGRDAQKRSVNYWRGLSYS